jgi:hypothetical protein
MYNNIHIGSTSDTSMASIPHSISNISEGIASHFMAPGTSSASAQQDSFKTEFHLKSGRSTTINSFSVFDCSQCKIPQSIIDDDYEPWYPFQTLGDFKFSEITHRAALNKDQTNQLLTLIWMVSKGETKLTLQSHHNVTEAWSCLAKLMMPVM